MTRSATLAVLVGTPLLAPVLIPAVPGALGSWLARYWPITAGQTAYAVIHRPGAVAPAAGPVVLAAATALIGVAGRLAFRRRDL
ncbi:hypothetical protein [Dactylosporangium matsuzakiense]|uniref:hypothetical protein n=1 Tax=Dactylosporangium matsuzakiense TaxID=53360 RepID=UPI0022F2EDB2|nr:hypothetical protein [Dactylosporangium matsuzakiense]